MEIIYDKLTILEQLFLEAAQLIAVIRRQDDYRFMLDKLAYLEDIERSAKEGLEQLEQLRIRGLIQAIDPDSS